MPRKKFSIKDALSGGEVPIQAMVGRFATCCARAASGHAAALPSSVMISRRFIGPPITLSPFRCSSKRQVAPRLPSKANSDGSIDLYIQKDNPGSDKESNWLPAPAGKFILMLRMYWPNESDPSILDGT
jgi:hypothetical protein